MFPGPRELLPLLCRRRKEVTGVSSSLDFLSNQPYLSSDYVICKDFESPIVTIVYIYASIPTMYDIIQYKI